VGTVSGSNWDIASLASGATDTLRNRTLMLQVRLQIPAATTRRISDGSNRHSYTSTAGGTAVADADLTLVKTLTTTGTIYDGEHVTFQIQWEYGPDAAQAVVVSDASFSDLSNVRSVHRQWERLAVVIGILHPLLPVQPIRLRSPARFCSRCVLKYCAALQRRSSDGSNRHSYYINGGGSTVADADLTLVKTLTTRARFTMANM